MASKKKKRNPLWYRESWLAKLDDDVALIIRMRRERHILEEIGDILGVTREAIRQREAKIAKAYGWAVFEPARGKRLYNLEQAVAAVKKRKKFVSEPPIAKACEAGELECVHRPGRGVKWLLTEKGLRQLMRHRCVTRKKPCRVCGKIFVPKKGRRGTGTCSARCCATWKHRRYLARGTTLPIPETMYALHRTLVEELKAAHVLISDKSQQWLFWRDALDASGITTMQFTYLRIMRILKVKRSKTRRWRGEPARMYSTSEMAIVRRVFKQFEDKKRSKK